MKKFLGILLIITGIALGTYVGIWLMFVGGIIQVIEACKNNWEAVGIAVGIIKVIFCELGGIITWICSLIGFKLIAEN